MGFLVCGWRFGEMGRYIFNWYFGWYVVGEGLMVECFFVFWVEFYRNCGGGIEFFGCGVLDFEFNFGVWVIIEEIFGMS